MSAVPTLRDLTRAAGERQRERDAEIRVRFAREREEADRQFDTEFTECRDRLAELMRRDKGEHQREIEARRQAALQISAAECDQEIKAARQRHGMG